MAKTLSIVFGVVFTLVAVLGFMNSGIVGREGLFVTNALHDIVHLLFGIVFLAIAFMSPAKAPGAFKIAGIIYLLLAVLGFLMIPGGGDLLGLVTMNTADHWLHVVLGVVLIAAGSAVKKSGANGSPLASGPSM